MAKNKLRTKLATAVLTGAAINIAVISLLSHSFELDTILLYMGLNALVLFLINFRKAKAIDAAIMGAGIVGLFNYGLVYLAGFSLSVVFVIFAALQQGIITYFAAKMGGLK